MLSFITVLTTDEIESIDKAGSQGAKQFTAKVIMRRVALVMFVGAVGFGILGSTFCEKYCFKF
jgi:hypothetical protein